MQNTMQPRYTTRDVSQATGVTARMLQWWDEQGIVVPERRGRRRTYSPADLSEILIIEELRLRHISLQQIRKVLRFLRIEFGERLADAITPGSDHHLLLDGQQIYLETSDRQIVDLVKNARQPMFVICLSDAVRRLQAAPAFRPGSARAAEKGAVGKRAS